MHHGEESCLVDLNFVRFTVSKDKNGLRQFASVVAGALADTTGNSIGADQVLAILEEIELDMLMDQTGSDSMNATEARFNFSVCGWKKRNSNGLQYFNPKWLDDTKKLYRSAPEADKWRYWPQERALRSPCGKNQHTFYHHG